MRVLYVITGLSTGGAEMMLLKLLERLDRERFTPAVISLTSLGDIGPRIAALGIPVQALGMATRWPRLALLRRLREMIREWRPDVVHTWLYHADLLGGLAARWAGVPVVCWGIRSSNLDVDKTAWTTRVIRRVCAWLSGCVPDRIFLNSEAARGIHAALGYAPGKMSVIPNGFDLSRFAPDPVARARVRASLGCTEDTLLVGMVGRYDPLKNHAGFVAAMSILRPRLSALKIAMVGKGVTAQNDPLVSLLQAETWGQDAMLLGERTDIPALMAAFDILVCPSHAEAFPNVIGEAMATGVPCVATDVGDCAFLVGETGRVVPVGDMAALAGQVLALLGLSPAQRAALGALARERVEACFDIATVVRRYEAAYETLKGEMK